MDPNAALETARTLAAEIGDDKLIPQAREEAAATLAETFQALDGWLSSGGFKPHDWQ